MNHFKSQNRIILSIIILSALLRLVWLDRFPPSLYTDEIDQGYNAYSIMRTGKDEHGAFLPISIRSFGDWKPPLQTYLMIPFISIFGLNEYSVRLPSAILGILSVILGYLLVKELFDTHRWRNSIALLTMFMLAVSPWHILQSRSAMLVMVALFFLQTGIYLFLKAKTLPNLYILSSLSFVLSMYSYYGMRMVTPLIVIALFYLYRKSLMVHKMKIVLSIFGALILLAPLVIAFVREPNVILGRAKTVSVFYDQGINLRKWELITQDPISASPLFVRFLHNSVYMYGKNIVQRFLSHLEMGYLFLTGDMANPFRIPGMGILYIGDSLFLIVGIYMLMKLNGKFLIIVWLVIAILPAAFTFLTPSSNRTFNAVVPFMMITAIGIYGIKKKINRNLTVAVLTSLVYTVSIGYFLHQYFLILPLSHAEWWNYGWKEAVFEISKIQNNYDNIIVPEVNMPYIYFLFYLKYNPAKFQKEAIRTYVADQFGFEHVDAFDKYFFPGDFRWEDTKDSLVGKSLYVIHEQKAPKDVIFDHVVSYPDGKPVIKLFPND